MREYRVLLSERAALRDIISQAPENSVITRMSFEARLRKVEGKLKAYEGYSKYVSNAQLTFQGKPVELNYGIDAEFGANAISSFARAVRLIGASRNVRLAPEGRVPRQEDCRLLITDTARESFGFRVEEASRQPAMLDESSAVGAAIEQIKRVLEALVGADENFVEIIDGIDGRALDAIHNFIKIMVDNRAVCALEFRGDVFRFNGVKQVRRSMERLSKYIIREYDASLTGYFEGFLPNSRLAEIRISQADSECMDNAIGTTISAKIASHVEFDIGDSRHRMFRLGVHIQMVGNGRPSYVIDSCELLDA